MKNAMLIGLGLLLLTTALATTGYAQVLEARAKVKGMQCSL